MENNDDPIQRALNDAKKRELEKKYGAHFGEGDSKLPPEVEAEWLRQIEEFELQYQHGKRTTVRQFVGNPEVKPLAEIPADTLEQELQALLDLMESNNILVHLDREVTTEEAYRFVSAELMNEEMDDIRIEGMTHNFIYSEFYPEEGEEPS